MTTSGRPTFRCLEDLTTDWESSAHQGEASSGNPRVPLEDLQHPIVRKAAADFPATAGDSDISRESISGLSDPVWWKVKIGRWRGAVWEDAATGQAWLCAAGYRREGESTDFYKQFMADVRAKGASNFLPTDEDRERLSDELKEAALSAWEKSIYAQVRLAARELIAQGGGDRSLSIAPPAAPDPIAKLSLTIVLEELDGERLLDLVVGVECLDFARLPLVQWAELVALQALDEREQRWGSLVVAGVPHRSQMYEGEEVDVFQKSLAEGIEMQAIATSEGVAHYTHTARLFQSTVEGEAVRAACGSWFVPTRDHVRAEKCTVCVAVMRSLPKG